MPALASSGRQQARHGRCATRSRSNGAAPALRQAADVDNGDGGAQGEHQRQRKRPPPAQRGRPGQAHSIMASKRQRRPFSAGWGLQGLQPALSEQLGEGSPQVGARVGGQLQLRAQRLCRRREPQVEHKGRRHAQHDGARDAPPQRRRLRGAGRELGRGRRKRAMRRAGPGSCAISDQPTGSPLQS